MDIWPLLVGAEKPKASVVATTKEEAKMMVEESFMMDTVQIDGM
jgi:hypothetical protein